MGKKKGAANKLARMSDEERARYLQHRAEIEEEARRRKQQLIAIFMKNKLKREEAFSRLNLAKINQEWRTVLRNLKCQQLRDEIRVVEQYFGDALARKNRQIERLLGELDACEEMYAHMLSAHVRNVTTLVALHAERAEHWRTGYLSDKKELLNTFHSEISVYKERKLCGFRELECVFYGLEASVERERAAASDLQASKVDSVKSKMILQLQAITSDREQQMDGLWRQFQSVLAVYLQHTEQFHDEYVQLRQRDDEDTRIIRFHYAEVRRTTNLIAELKHRLDRQVGDHRVHVDALQRYKRLLQVRQASRKRSIEEVGRRDRQGIRWMVVRSDEAITKLRAINAKGENVLNIGLMCRKLETDRERLMPIVRRMAFEDTNNEQASNDGNNLKQMGAFEKETVTILADMEHFWVRFNSANIDCVCLADEKAALKLQNRRLKDQLKRYLTNVTLVEGSGGTADAKLRPNSMLVVRCGTAATARDVCGGSGSGSGVQQRPRRPVTCIEANLSQAVRSRSLVTPKVRMPDVFAYDRY